MQRVDVSLNEIPMYSPWPARLLGLDHFSRGDRTRADTVREFEVEKWGSLLKQVQSQGQSDLQSVERLEFGQCDNIVHWERGSFTTMHPVESRDRHVDLYAEVMRQYLSRASCVVELGAGYGGNLFRLAQQDEFARLPLISGEMTKSGRSLTRLISEATGVPISVGNCDLASMVLQDVDVPPDGIIFTSYALQYVSPMPLDLLRWFASFKPLAVLHFEPILQHYSGETLHGLMCRRYFELNRYSDELWTTLTRAREVGMIDLRSSGEPEIGMNPFLPISVIEWNFCREDEVRDPND